LLAVIVVWNTMHFQACVRKLRSDAEQVIDDDLRYISLLLRHHIGSMGSGLLCREGITQIRGKTIEEAPLIKIYTLPAIE
jgi:Tn3 transposase DDE domain